MLGRHPARRLAALVSILTLASAALIGCGEDGARPPATTPSNPAATPSNPAATPSNPAATPSNPAATPSNPAAERTVAEVRSELGLGWADAEFSDEPPGKLRTVTLAGAAGRRVVLTLRYEAPLLFSESRSWSPAAVDRAIVLATESLDSATTGAGAGSAAESEVTVREGEAIVIRPGYRATLVNAAYAHMDGDRNSSNAWLTLEGPDGTTKVALERDHPGPPVWVKAQGIELALDIADAYGKQASAVIRVRSIR